MEKLKQQPIERKSTLRRLVFILTATFSLAMR